MFSNLETMSPLHLTILVVLIIVALYYFWAVVLKEGFAASDGSQPSVILFTRGPSECRSCSNTNPNACAICQFNRLAKWYGRINVYHIPDLEHYSDIPVNMITKFPTIAFMPEGLANYNLVRIYKGPFNTMEIERWIKSLPGSSL